MHADLLDDLVLLYLSLDHDLCEEIKAEQTCCQSHYHLLIGAILV